MAPMYGPLLLSHVAHSCFHVWLPCMAPVYTAVTSTVVTATVVTVTVVTATAVTAVIVIVVIVRSK